MALIYLCLEIFVFCIGQLYAEEMLNCYNVSFPANIPIKENAPIDTVFITLDIDPDLNTTNTWQLINAEMTSYFTLETKTDKTNVKVKKSLDLLVNCTKEENYELTFSCGSLTQTTAISVQYVGKHEVNFQNRDVTMEISENFDVGYELKDLTDAYEDEDCECYCKIVFALISPPSGEKYNADKYIGINATAMTLYVKKQLDYEEQFCDTGDTILDLRVTVRDENTPNFKTDLMTIKVPLIDEDDTPPVFLKENCDYCMKDCKTLTKEININLDYGKNNFYSFDFPAKDFDTSPSVLRYNIVTVEPELFGEFIELDFYTGALSIDMSAEDLTNSTDFYGQKQILVILQVNETSSLQVSDNMTVTLLANVVMETTTSEPTTEIIETTFDITTTPDITSPSNEQEVTSEKSVTETTTNQTSEDFSFKINILSPTSYVSTPSSHKDNSSGDGFGDLSTTVVIVIFVVVGVTVILFIMITIIRIKRAPKSLYDMRKLDVGAVPVDDGHSNGVINNHVYENEIMGADKEPATIEDNINDNECRGNDEQINADEKYIEDILSDPVFPEDEMKVDIDDVAMVIAGEDAECSSIKASAEAITIEHEQDYNLGGTVDNSVNSGNDDDALCQTYMNDRPYAIGGSHEQEDNALDFQENDSLKIDSNKVLY